MRKFDTKVQYLKYKVLREVARQAWNDTAGLMRMLDIPNDHRARETSRPCVAACIKSGPSWNERVKLAMGGDKANPNVIEVIDIACDECPVGRLRGHGCRAAVAWPTAAKTFAAAAPSPLTATKRLILTSPNVSTAASCAKVVPIQRHHANHNAAPAKTPAR